jgi:tetratricopeptide (TPR) repeat protein
VTEIDPTMIDARLVQGIHDYVVGSLPFTYRFFGFLVGFRGDREQGIRAVQLVAEKGLNNRVDAQVLLAVIYRRDRKPQLAIPLLLELTRKYPRNYLFRFELVQMYADAGNKEHALEVLRVMEQLKARKEPGYSRLRAEKIYYSRGNLLFWYRDFDEALENLSLVTSNVKELDLNTATFAWLRTGQIRDLKGQRNQALDAYRQAIALAPDSDAARESQRFLSTPYRRAKG